MDGKRNRRCHHGNASTRPEPALICAPGIFGAASAYRSARQLGHSVAIAERHYVGVVKVPKEATTLEEAMGVEGEVAMIQRGAP